MPSSSKTANSNEPANTARNRRRVADVKRTPDPGGNCARTARTKSEGVLMMRSGSGHPFSIGTLVGRHRSTYGNVSRCASLGTMRRGYRELVMSTALTVATLRRPSSQQAGPRAC